MYDDTSVKKFVTQSRGRPLKTRMCVYQLAGKCFKGDMCSFAHNPEELNNPKQMLCPVVASTGTCFDPRCPLGHSEEEICRPKPQVKTKVCRYFASGKCLAGEFCRHAHFVHEFQPTQATVNVSPSSALPEERDSQQAQGHLVSLLVDMLTKATLSPSPSMLQ